MGPKILRDGLRGNWTIVGCEETTQYLFESINTSFSAPNVRKANAKKVGSMSINLMRTIVPNTGDEGIRFIGCS